MSTPRAEDPKATSREWVGLAVLALPCLLYSMDLTVLNLAVPKLSAALQPTSSELLWIVDIYGFVLAGALIPMGVLGDRAGRRWLLLTRADRAMGKSRPGEGHGRRSCVRRLAVPDDDHAARADVESVVFLQQLPIRRRIGL